MPIENMVGPIKPADFLFPVGGQVKRPVVPGATSPSTPPPPLPSDQIDLPEFNQIRPEIPAFPQESLDLSEGTEQEKGKLEELQKSLQQIIGEVNEHLGNSNVRLNFDLFQATGELYVRIIDRSTNSVVKTLPPSEFLDLRAKITKGVGLILDEQT